MPYIKKELRPIFDFAIHSAQMRYVGYVANITVECIKFGVRDMAPEDMDGCLNYVFTQLLRKLENLTYAKIIMGITINDLFWMKPKYFRYERVKGLLGCMIDEYRRRAWRRQRRVVKILKKLLGTNAYKLSVYEEEKIKKNGDLQ